MRDRVRRRAREVVEGEARWRTREKCGVLQNSRGSRRARPSASAPAPTDDPPRRFPSRRLRLRRDRDVRSSDEDAAAPTTRARVARGPRRRAAPSPGSACPSPPPTCTPPPRARRRHRRRRGVNLDPAPRECSAPLGGTRFLARTSDRCRRPSGGRYHAALALAGATSPTSDPPAGAAPAAASRGARRPLRAPRRTRSARDRGRTTTGPSRQEARVRSAPAPDDWSPSTIRPPHRPVETARSLGVACRAYQWQWVSRANSLSARSLAPTDRVRPKSRYFFSRAFRDSLRQSRLALLDGRCRALAASEMGDEGSSRRRPG